MKINLNQFVTVKLTDKGKEHLEKFHKSYNPDFNIDTWINKDGTYRTQMHNLMLEFGGVLFPAFEPPFERCSIEVE